MTSVEHCPTCRERRDNRLCECELGEIAAMVHRVGYAQVRNEVEAWADDNGE